MGVTFYPCARCDKTFPDSGVYLECETCLSFFCGYGKCKSFFDRLEKRMDERKRMTLDRLDCPACRGLIMPKHLLLESLSKRAGYSTVKEARRSCQKYARVEYLRKKKLALEKRLSRVQKRKEWRERIKQICGDSKMYHELNEEQEKKYNEDPVLSKVPIMDLYSSAEESQMYDLNESEEEKPSCDIDKEKAKTNATESESESDEEEEKEEEEADT